MNKIELISGTKNISECFSNMCVKDNNVEIQFELENMSIDTKESVLEICKYLNRLSNSGDLFYKEWVLVSNYPNAILLKAQDSNNNIKYLKIIKGGDKR